MTHVILIARIPLIDVIVPLATFVFNNALVFFKTEKAIRKFVSEFPTK